MRASPLVACSIAALLLGGCVNPFVTSTRRGRALQAPPPPVHMPGAGAQDADSSRIPGGIARKVVNGKRDPNVLIAIDGDLCTVSARTYRETQYGERVWCAWRPAGASR